MFTVTKKKLDDVANKEVTVTVKQIVSAGLVATMGLLVPPFGLVAAGIAGFVYGRSLVTRR